MNSNITRSTGSLTGNGPKRFVAGILLSLLSAALLLLAFHPFNQWYLAFFALIPMRLAEYRFFPLKWAGLGSGIGVGVWLAEPGRFCFLHCLHWTQEEASEKLTKK